MTKEVQNKKEKKKPAVNNIKEVKKASEKAKGSKASSTVNKDHDGKNEYEVRLEQDRDQLQEELAKVKTELEAKSNEHLKLFAEFDNFRKRSSQEKNEFAQYANGNVVKDLLPVLDSFDSSQAALAKDEVNLEDLKEGFNLIYKQLNAMLVDLNVKKIATVGEKFDPNLHEAVAQTEETDKEEGLVVQEFRSGYLIKDKVLRHAMVVVAK